MPGRGKRPAQGVVRASALERSLEAMNAELGEKVTKSFVNYHQMFIAPIEVRIRFLELPWYSRLPKELGRMILRSWVKLTFLLSWRITEEKMREEGWRQKWYHGLVRRTDEDDGFIFVLKPFHWLAKLYGVWLKFKQHRQDRRDGAELAAKIAAEKAAEAEEPTEEPEEPVLKAVPDDA